MANQQVRSLYLKAPLEARLVQLARVNKVSVSAMLLDLLEMALPLYWQAKMLKPEPEIKDPEDYLGNLEPESVTYQKREKKE